MLGFESAASIEERRELVALTMILILFIRYQLMMIIGLTLNSCLHPFCDAQAFNHVFSPGSGNFPILLKCYSFFSRKEIDYVGSVVMLRVLGEIPWMIQIGWGPCIGGTLMRATQPLTANLGRRKSFIQSLH